jgi:hypothetical protein
MVVRVTFQSYFITGTLPHETTKKKYVQANMQQLKLELEWLRGLERTLLNQMELN